MKETFVLNYTVLPCFPAGLDSVAKGQNSR
jgi:hypothetical protein